MADVFAQSIIQVDNSTLLGVSSKNLGRLKSFSKNYNLNDKYCFRSYEALLSCGEIEIVYIALPNSIHHKWIVKCIEAGKHILVEKPATTNSSELKDIKNKLKLKSLFFCEGFMYLHHPRTQQFLSTVKNGSIGEPMEMETSFGCKILEKEGPFQRIKNQFKKEPRQFNKSLGGGSILDLGCYLTSLSLIIAKIKSSHEVDAVSCEKTEINYESKKVDVEAQTELLFGNGFKSRIQTSFQTDLGQRTYILGSKGKMVIENTWGCKCDVFSCNENYIKIKNTIFDNPYSYQIFNISNWLIQGFEKPQNPAFTLVDSFENMRILDKWRSSLPMKSSDR